MSSTTSTGIAQIGLVMIPTVDQDAAIDFYVEKLGFEKRSDVPFGGKYRWVEVYPPSGTTGIALPQPREGETIEPKEVGVTLTTADADATHAELTARGVDVDAEVTKMGDPIPPMFWLRDPEGNSLMVVQSPPGA